MLGLFTWAKNSFVRWRKNADTPEFMREVNDLVPRVLEILKSQDFEKGDGILAATFVGAYLVHQGHLPQVLARSADYVKHFPSSGFSEMIGLASMSENIFDVDNHYVVRAQIALNSISVPQVVPLRRFVSEIGDQDVLDYFDNLPRSKPFGGFVRHKPRVTGPK
jgi:hypothetical protein